VVGNFEIEKRGILDVKKLILRVGLLMLIGIELRMLIDLLRNVYQHKVDLKGEKRRTLP